jgi:excisionase family DNA binding protein
LSSANDFGMFSQCSNPAAPEPKRGLTVQEAAAYLGTTVPAIRQLIYRRELPFVKLGKRHIIDRQDLDKFIERKKRIA